MVHKIFDKNAGDTSTHTGIKIYDNQEMANELNRSITATFKEHKTFSSFRDKIWSAYLADMLLLKITPSKIAFQKFFG